VPDPLRFTPPGGQRFSGMPVPSFPAGSQGPTTGGLDQARRRRRIHVVEHRTGGVGPRRVRERTHLVLPPSN
jgi:hypothetical protein